MKRYLLSLLVLLTILGGLTFTTTKVAHAATNSCITPSGTNVLQGNIDGANYIISVPSNWNGTLVLYSHGYVFPGNPLVAHDAGDALTRAALLQQGYALAGSSYSQNGWALQQAFHDQIALLDFFNTTCGHPTRTIAWGHSLGGIITAGLVQLNPGRFAGALPMCGVLAGGVGTWNQALDSAFAFKVLLAGNALPIVHIANPTGAFKLAEGTLEAAQQNVQGRARIALSAALADVPGWFDTGSPEPASRYITFNGDLNIPVLTMHTTGDGLVVNQVEQAYASVVRSEGDANLLRQTFVHRAGHCAFTPAETLAAFQTLIHRLDTGKWENSTNPDLMNQEAAALGPTFNTLGDGPVPPAFLNFEPTTFLRPFDARD